MLDSTVMQEIGAAADGLKVEAAALAAVAHIESALKPHVMIGGRAEPLIRFEGHYFDRRLTGAVRDEARRQGLSSPGAGKVANPASQSARWALLSRACAIDRKAAWESTSWGMGQVMGAHWAWLGYASVDALVADARSGARGQLRLMARYIDKAGLAGALRRHDWAALARGYNGPGFRANAYDTKLASAYRRYATVIGSGAAFTAEGILRHGARGDAVRSLQTALTAQGYPLTIDGVFGTATQRAVTAFQKRNGLVADGIAGPKTLTALGGEAASRGPVRKGIVARLLTWLAARLLAPAG